jgi:hypothetical protein
VTIGVRRMAVAGSIFLVALAPAFLQLGLHRSEFVRLLSSSTGRSSGVGPGYYIDLLRRYDGPLLLVVWTIGIVAAAVRRSRSDLFILLWLGVVASFFQLYPLKAYNYVLPLTPALALVGANALVRGARGLSEPRWTRRRSQAWGLGAVFLAVLTITGSAQATASIVRSRDYAGLREAALWLRDHTSPDAGVMTLSGGSAQYIFSFYAQRPSYPFGRFRLATVLPGGRVVNPTTGGPHGDPPMDWVSGWPPGLIRDGKVSYFVYYVASIDDPPEAPLVNSLDESDFKRLIERYGGELVHTVYIDHEPRVWVYRATEQSAAPVLDIRRVDSIASRIADPPWRVRIRGSGFTMDSQVNLYYHRAFIGTVPTNDSGQFRTVIDLLGGFRERWWFVGIDGEGDGATLVGRAVR